MAQFRGGAATEWAIRTFGGLMRIINGTRPSAAGVVTPLLGADPERVGWTIINLGASVGYLGFDESTSATRGIYIGANGGSANSSVIEDANLPVLPVYVLCGAVQDFFVVEIRREHEVKEDT